jgi:hypothetical protein
MMYRLATAIFFVCTPALAQNAEALRDCTPIGTTAGGETVYGLGCAALKPENKSPEYKPNMPMTELKDTVIPQPGGLQNPEQTRTTTK